jgi:hypothetical protein
MCYRRDLFGYKSERCNATRSITYYFEMADPTAHDRRGNTMAGDNKDLAFVNNTPVRDAKPGAP